MRGSIERLLAERKSLLAILLLLVLIAAIGRWLMLPSQTETPVELSPRIQMQWRKLLPLVSALRAAGIDDAATQPFSPIELPVAGAALIAWRPMGGGGEMQLEADWQAVPALFSGLPAAGCGLRLSLCSRKNRLYG